MFIQRIIVGISISFVKSNLIACSLFWGLKNGPRRVLIAQRGPWTAEASSIRNDTITQRDFFSNSILEFVVTVPITKVLLSCTGFISNLSSEIRAKNERRRWSMKEKASPPCPNRQNFDILHLSSLSIVFLILFDNLCFSHQIWIKSSYWPLPIHLWEEACTLLLDCG